MSMTLAKKWAAVGIAGAVALSSCVAPALAAGQGWSGQGQQQWPQRGGALSGRGMVYGGHGGGGHADWQRGGGGGGRSGWHGDGGGYGGGWHGDHDGWHRGWGGGWAPWVVGGLAAGAVVAATTPYYYGSPYYGDPCYRLTATYDQWGNFAGRQWVNIC